MTGWLSAHPGLACVAMSLLGGCLYVSPAWKPDPDLAPEIIRPLPPLEDIPVVLDRPIRLTVVAEDPEGEELDFVWIVPVDVQYDWSKSPAGGNSWYSVLRLPDDDILYDQRIEVLVTDGANEVGVSWLVEAP
ncbi:MAG: hypothetical protein JRI25_08990 [Deltaproteobacteria bacterium]|nr:hypothetical protein [Deltaproteobacteria bacterium]